MKRCILSFIALFFILFGYSQEEDRIPLRGQVLYRNSVVPYENVINTTSEKATITNDKGAFLIYVKEGDELVFRSVINIQQLKFEKPGLYSIDIAMDGREAGNIPLQVKHMPRKEGGPSPV